MALDEHLWNPRLQGEHKKVPNSTENGRCISRHPYEYEETSRRVGGRSVLKQHSCNYRWQAYKAALDDAALYNGPHRGQTPWYRAFMAREGLPKYERVVLVYNPATKRMMRRTVQSRRPTEADQWNVATDKLNYRSTCNRPYWHEAHHIVPNGALHAAIEKIGEGEALHQEIAIKVRDGLLKAQYNLNHKLNMIVLPIERQIAEAIELPIHVDRLDPGANYRHGSYSDTVQKELEKVFEDVRSKVDPAVHETPPMNDVKDRIVPLSIQLRARIKAAGAASPGTSLDRAFPESAQVPEGLPPNSTSI